MTFAQVHDIPADEAIYRQISARIGEELPKGLIVHLALKTDAGQRHLSVWQSAEDWHRFNDERVRPAVHGFLTMMGLSEMPPDPPIDEFEVIDVWMGDGVTPGR
jgi:hypothetical protein